jgi:hypothetical protein
MFVAKMPRSSYSWKVPYAFDEKAIQYARLSSVTSNAA